MTPSRKISPITISVMPVPSVMACPFVMVVTTHVAVPYATAQEAQRWLGGPTARFTRSAAPGGSG